MQFQLRNVIDFLQLQIHNSLARPKHAVHAPSYNYEQNFLPGEIKLTFEVASLPSNRPIGVTGVTVTDVVTQKGNPEALSSSLVTEVAVSFVL